MATKRITIALKLKGRNYGNLLALGQTIVKGMAANVISYPFPNPSLLTANGHLAKLGQCIAKWGPPSNRGSKKDLMALKEIRDEVKKDISQLARYAMNTTPDNAELFTAAGFPLKSPPHRIGILQAVRNLHQFISRTVQLGAIKLKWNKPPGTSNIIVNGYTVMRSATAVYADALPVGIVTKTSFIDENPLNGINYYWVTPLHTAGDGVISDVCVASAYQVPA